MASYLRTCAVAMLMVKNTTPMKLLPAFLIPALLATSGVLFAEEPAAQSTAAKKAPLASTDKKFVKDQTEGLYFVMELIGQAKTSGQTETVKKLSDEAKAEFDKVWGDVAGFATNNGEELPKELKGGDKSAAERLKKAGKNWDKEFLKLTGKEVKKMAHAFKDSKALVSPDLKKIASDWGPTMSGFEGKWDNAEKEVSKAKQP
jgi:predicted outer membrane protein